MTRITLVAALALLGCNTVNNPPSQGQPDAANNPHPDGGTSGSVAPKEGVWNYSDSVVSNTCPPNTPVGEAGHFVIDKLTVTSFEIVPGDGTAAFPCSYSATGFHCPDRISAIEDLHPGLDAVVTVHGVVDGSFSNATHGTGDQAATASCAGTACATFGANAFPCMAKANFVITAQ